MAGSEAAVTGGVITAHPPHLGPKGLKVGEAVAESAGFGGAARGVVFGIEENHQGRSTELVAAALDTLGIRQGDQGRAIPGSKGGGHGGWFRHGPSP
jgi:hypothetical protein